MSSTLPSLLTETRQRVRLHVYITSTDSLKVNVLQQAFVLLVVWFWVFIPVFYFLTLQLEPERRCKTCH